MEGFRSTNIVSIFILGTLALVFVMGMTSPAFAVTVTFTNFSNTDGLTLSGVAEGNIDNTPDDPLPVLRLVPAITKQSGSAFSTTTINAADFSTEFQFRITDRGGENADLSEEFGADGFVFVIQTDSASQDRTGGGMGYGGIPKSVGIEFDTWHNPFDPDSNHIGILTNGDVDTKSQFIDVFGDNFVFIGDNDEKRFDDGKLQKAWIDYDGTTLKVFIKQEAPYVKPDEAVIEVDLDIPAIIGKSDAFVGFTAGTGGNFGNYDIVNWTYSDSFIPF